MLNYEEIPGHPEKITNLGTVDEIRVSMKTKGTGQIWKMQPSRFFKYFICCWKNSKKKKTTNTSSRNKINILF